MKKSVKVFISYAKEDFKTAKKLYDDLKLNGVEPWMDTEDILTGQCWEYEISKAIRESSYFLALLSFKSVSKRGYIQKELKIALNIFEEFPEPQIFLLPVRLDNCKPFNKSLQKLQWCDLFPSYNKGLKRILHTLFPISANKLVNRVEQLTEIREILNKMFQKCHESYYDVINWYGIPGIGKTTLGVMIADLCGKMSIPFLCSDFQNRYYDDKNDYTIVLEDIIHGYEVFEFQRVLNRYREEKNRCQAYLKNVVDIFLNFFYELTVEGPVVLLFDSAEKADPDLIVWLEEQIIIPLSMTRKCLFIWMGRYQQVWNEDGIRRRVILKKLDALSLEATNEQLGYIWKKHAPMPFEMTEKEVESECSRIHRLTLGHPLCNEEVFAAIREYKTVGNNPEDHHLINIMMGKVIDMFVMKTIKPELSQACRILAAIRQFDVTILQEILSNFTIYFKETKSYLKVIGQLTETSLVEWDFRRKGYVLDEIIRHILSQYMRLNEQKLYLEIIEAAADIYKTYIKEVNENRSIYVIERLFHQATINDIRKQMKLEIINNPYKELEDCLEEYYNESNERLKFAYNATIQLYEELKQDMELEKILTKEEFEQLRDIVRNHLLFLRQKQ
ncbi:MAG: toll/interleukin-1 receptor domain-containing protein [Desulfobacterales bacterium]|nr:toll/interleukin-1 receptor domain-containing protein [Desulfobacterales bacterium]